MNFDENAVRVVDANGMKIAYEARGRVGDPVLLLVMGLGQQMIGWPDELVDALVEAGLRVVRFDNRDMGRSTWVEDESGVSAAAFVEARMRGEALPVPYTLSDMADDALGLMDALGIETACVAGASMGGMIAQLMAVKAPERVVGLVSMMSSSGAPGLPGPEPAVQARLFVGPPKGSSAEEVLAYTAETLRMIAFPDPARPADAFRSLIDRAAARGQNRAGYGRQLLAIVEDGSRVERLRTVRVPTLVIHGAVDPLIPVACGVDTAAHVAGARLVVVERMGHDLPPSELAGLVGLMAEFVRAGA